MAEYLATIQVYQSLDDIDYKHRSLALRGCRLNAWFAVDRETRVVKILSDACRLRWCPLCSQAKSRFISQAVCEFLKDHPRPKILTLTLAHSDDSLDSQITRLYACFRQLRRKKAWCSKVRGGVWFFQVKVSQRSQQWHPHLHILLDSEYIPHELLKQSWESITGDSHIVDIRTIYKARVAAEYVARYAARPAQLDVLDAERRLEVVQSLHGRRLAGGFGSAKGVSLSGKSPDSQSDLTTICSWESMRDLSPDEPALRILFTCYRLKGPLPLWFDIDKLLTKLKPAREPISWVGNQVVIEPSFW